VKWISVKERLPEENGLYIAYVPDEENYDKERIETDYFMDGIWLSHTFYTRRINGITHWMPLPTKPEDVEE
jgi:hypothetical protein